MMSKIVVAKLVRLGMDGDKFKKDSHIATVRKSVKIDETAAKEFNKRWEVRGQLYVFDKEATAERDANVKQQLADKASKAAGAAQVDEATKSAEARVAEANARKAEAEADKAEAEAKAAIDKLPKKAKTERETLIDKAAELEIEHAKDATIAQLKELIAVAEDLK